MRLLGEEREVFGMNPARSRSQLRSSLPFSPALLEPVLSLCVCSSFPIPLALALVSVSPAVLVREEGKTWSFNA